MLRIYPNDADGDALQRVADHGSDMSQPMSIDFCVAIPDEISGKAVAEVATSSGYVTKVVKDHNGTSWTCYCTKEMVATYNAIIAAQDELNELSKPFAGYSDGWVTGGNVDKVNCRRTSHCSRRLLRLFSRPLCNPQKCIFEKQNINRLSSFVLGKSQAKRSPSIGAVRRG